MAAGCCGGGCSSSKPPVDKTYRRILWGALIINAGDVRDRADSRRRSRVRVAPG